MLYTVGLTGGIGSGKSTVANMFAELGASVVDADIISRAVTAPGQAVLTTIKEQFGEAYFRSDGSLDRAKMRQMVFSDDAARRALEALIHPRVRAETRRLLNAARGPYALLAVPLLIETGSYQALLSRILVVDCPEPLQITRTMARSQLSREQVIAIMAVQASRADRLRAANDVIDNGTDVSGLRPQVAHLHDLYTRLARDN